jgi:hypothetical protein
MRRFQTWLDERQLEALRAQSRRTGASVCELIRRAIDAQAAGAILYCPTRLFPAPKKTGKGYRKLSPDAVAETGTALAKRFGVDGALISRILSGKVHNGAK